MRPNLDFVRDASRRVLVESWRDADGFCPPNPTVYPHQWLWDSCFHAIAWGALGDARGVRELSACMSGRLATGFVPHMRYLGPTVSRGPLSDRSSFTQPPIFAHAARVLIERGLTVPEQILADIGHALQWLWEHRRTADGLVYIVHPWESGSDDSPRWDSWVGLDTYDKEQFRAHDRVLVDATRFDAVGAATWSESFVVAPTAFNAFVAHACSEYAVLRGEPMWKERAQTLSRTADEMLWDDAQGLWRDEPIIGGGPSAGWPTLDGVFGSLVTDDPAKANRALDQVIDPTRFGAKFGVSFVPPSHPSYDANAYWRGPAWPQLNYMTWLAALRWGRDDVAAAVARCSLAGAVESAFAEYWNPETGQGLGAVPQGWAALAAVYR